MIVVSLERTATSHELSSCRIAYKERGSRAERFGRDLGSRMQGEISKNRVDV